MKKHLCSTLMTSGVLLLAGAALILFPKEVSASVRSGLTLCTDTLLPSLFPFFVLSALVIKLDIARPLGAGLEPMMRPLFKLPGACSTALVLGLIGGYPTGAKTAAALYRDGSCSREQAQRLLGFCNNCGPAFLFGAVGCGIFGHPRYGLLLALTHYCAALFTGLIINRCEPVPCPHRTVCSKHKPVPLAAAFVDSVTESLRSMLDLCSFVLCFSAITRLSALSGLPELAARTLLPFLPSEQGEGFLLGLLEMTHGVTALSGGEQSVRLILTAALLGWGGLSVHCQVLSLLRDTNLSASTYLKGKALHGALSALFMWGALYGTDLICLGAGCALLFIPCTAVKKSSGKSVEGIV